MPTINFADFQGDFHFYQLDMIGKKLYHYGKESFEFPGFLKKPIILRVIKKFHIEA